MLREFQAKPEGHQRLDQAHAHPGDGFPGDALSPARPPTKAASPLNEQILVVDDEIISRRVIGHSLEKAGLKSTAVSHPDEALKLLETNNRST